MHLMILQRDCNLQRASHMPQNCVIKECWTSMWSECNCYRESRQLVIPPLIGGERVTCHWSKLSNALGRTKLSNALGQQYLELSTCTWSGRATWNHGKFACQSAIEVGQGFSLEKTLILQQENWFIIRQIWTFDVFKLLYLAPKMGRPCSATRSWIAVATSRAGKWLSYLQQNMPFLVKLNPEFSS